MLMRGGNERILQGGAIASLVECLPRCPYWNPTREHREEYLSRGHGGQPSRPRRLPLIVGLAPLNP